MKKRESEVRLEVGQMNNMPGRQKVEALLNGALGSDTWKAVDLERAYWQNDNATLVVEIDSLELWRLGENNATEALIAFGQFIRETRPEEIDSTVVRGKRIMRIWWD